MQISLTSVLLSGLLAPLAIAHGPPAPPPPPPPPAPLGKDCRCLPGDKCWPSAQEWKKLNETVEGQLVATVPLGSPCHEPNYDEAACKKIQDGWKLPQTHLTSSSSLMQPFFANQSCDPFTDSSSPCEFGNYVVYSVDVRKPAHAAAALKFAHDKNIRPVVRATGHDFLGRSSGAGGLGVWMWNMKTTEVKDWSDKYYHGKAITVGPGVVGSEAVKAAAEHDLVVVTGECPTVAVAGGYTQGGGHSALSGHFGLAADQTLSFDVVLADGRQVKATRSENSDLYWALSGGGGGNYGVVTSVTVRAHPAGKFGGALLQMSSAYTTQEKWWEAISEFYKVLPSVLDTGASVVHYASTSIFAITPVTLMNSTGEEVEKLFKPFLTKLDELAIPHKKSFTTLPYLEHYDTYMGPLPWGHIEVSSFNFGSRLIPQDTLENDHEAFMTALKKITAGGVLAVGSASGYKAPFNVNNAVLPAWRDTYIQMQLTTPWSNKPEDLDKMKAAQKDMTDKWNPAFAEITPNSGAYMNEADFREPNWKKEWFGANYEKLSQIKKKYDPEGLLYMFKGVNSDQWTVEENGRMCKAKA